MSIPLPWTMSRSAVGWAVGWAVEWAVGWHVHSHVGSRRNALMAATALADRRREHLDVEEFMRGYLADISTTSPGEAATG